MSKTESVQAGESIFDAARLMVDQRYGAIPVVENDGTLLGVLGVWDVVMMLVKTDALHETPCGTAVGDSLTVDADQPLGEALSRIASAQTSLVPVVEDGKLVGVLNHQDVHAQRLLRTELGPHAADVVTEVHPNDEMHSGMLGVYLLGGISALKCIRRAMDAIEMPEPKRVLDLPCGHGRVTRILKAAFPKAELFACDLNREGVDFCAETFGATPLYSTVKPEDLKVDGQFDLIWVGSLFTHFDLDRWPGFLEVISGMVAPGGLLVFTTLGRTNVGMLRAFNMTPEQIDRLRSDFRRTGFAYQPFPRMDNWGMTLTSPDWVRQQIALRPELELVRFEEKAWPEPSRPQDVVTCVKRPVPGDAGPR